MVGPVVGRRFGRYLIEALAGEGGMGAVFRAQDTDLRRPVALKVLRRGVEQDPDVAPRFLREARLVAKLRHRSIVGIYEVGEIDGTLYLAMEWLEGTTLRVWSKSVEGARSFEERLAVLREIAEALAYAHAQGVVHRDLKPSNIIIDSRGAPKIVDFGLARRLERTVDPHPLTFVTREDVILGTPRYMAPEQVVSMDVDSRADQFAWGVLAYELLAGVHPRELVSGKPFPSAQPPPLVVRCPGITDALSAAIQRTLSMAPETRFASMNELLQAWPIATPTATKQATGRGRIARVGGGGRFVLWGMLPIALAAATGGGVFLGRRHGGGVQVDAAAAGADATVPGSDAADEEASVTREPPAEPPDAMPASPPMTSMTKNEPRARLPPREGCVCVALDDVHAELCLELGPKRCTCWSDKNPRHEILCPIDWSAEGTCPTKTSYQGDADDPCDGIGERDGSRIKGHLRCFHCTRYRGMGVPKAPCSGLRYEDDKTPTRGVWSCPAAGGE